MSLSTILLVLAVLAAIWGVVASIRIFADLKQRGEKVSFLWLRLLLPLYVHRYSVITREEEGKPGPLFYQFVLAFNLALLAVVLALALR